MLLPTIPTSLLSLPTELLYEISEHLPPISYFHLSTLSRRLQAIFLPLFFRAHNDDAPQPGQFGQSEYRISGKDMVLLPALQLSFGTESLRGLTCTLSPGSYAVRREVGTLTRLVQRLKSLGYLTLNLVALNFHDTPYEKRGLVLRAWATQFAKLLNVVLERGNVELTLVYGNKSLGSKKYFRKLREDADVSVVAAGDHHHHQHHHIPAKSKTKAVRTTGLFPKLMQSFHLSKITTPTRVSHAPASPVDHRPPSPLQPPSPTHEEIVFQLPISAENNLETFNLHSPLLLRPPFLDWLTKTLNAGSRLTTLSLDKLTLSNPTISDPASERAIKERAEATFLPSITLPKLQKFSVGNCELLWEDLVRFLARHNESLVDLDLYRCTFRNGRSQTNTGTMTSPAPTDKSLVFPNLKTIVATPEFLLALLSSPSASSTSSTQSPSTRTSSSSSVSTLVSQNSQLASFRSRYPSLQTISMTSDYYGMPPYGYLYERFDGVFRFLEGLGVGTSALHSPHAGESAGASDEKGLELELRFLGGIGLEKWLERFSSSCSSSTPTSPTTSPRRTTTTPPKTNQKQRQKQIRIPIIHTLHLSTDHRFFFTPALMRLLIPFVGALFERVGEVVFWTGVVLNLDMPDQVEGILGAGADSGVAKRDTEHGEQGGLSISRYKGKGIKAFGVDVEERVLGLLRDGGCAGLSGVRILANS